jgi:hypothetical protein
VNGQTMLVFLAGLRHDSERELLQNTPLVTPCLAHRGKPAAGRDGRGQGQAHGREPGPGRHTRGPARLRAAASASLGPAQGYGRPDARGNLPISCRYRARVGPRAHQSRPRAVRGTHARRRCRPLRQQVGLRPRKRALESARSPSRVVDRISGIDEHPDAGLDGQNPGADALDHLVENGGAVGRGVRPLLMQLSVCGKLSASLHHEMAR